MSKTVRCTACGDSTTNFYPGDVCSECWELGVSRAVRDVESRIPQTSFNARTGRGGGVHFTGANVLTPKTAEDLRYKAKVGRIRAERIRRNR